MKIAESFSLPPLSDDEDDEIVAKDSVAGRSMTAAARTPSGTPLLTDGFGMYTAAVGGLRTASRDLSSNASKSRSRLNTRGSPKSRGQSRGQSGSGGEEEDEAEAARRRYLNKKEIITPVDPESLPPQLSGPVGKGPPFVWNPGQFDSIEDSQIRTTSILSADALDSVHFARPRGAQSYPKPRSSANSAKVLGKSYSGPGYQSPVQLSTSEFKELGQLRGTSFSPFSIQEGKPRPDGVTFDVPFDNSIRNIVPDQLWRKQGAECDRTPLPTTKQGHRARTAPHFTDAEEARARGHTTRGVTSPINAECAGRYPLADGNGIVGGAGKRGGSYKEGYRDPRDYSNTFNVKPLNPKSGESLVPFENTFVLNDVSKSGGSVRSSSPLHSPIGRRNSMMSERSRQRPGTVSGSTRRMGGEGAKNNDGVRELSPNSRRRRDAEYTIHDDPLANLDPKVLQLLNEKNIVSRLWPASRMDVRMSVRERFTMNTDKFKDSELIGTKLLGSRYMSQGLDSIKNFHATDEVDCLDSSSLVQQERRENEFPTPPWDGTLRNIAATQIGLWRDPGWDVNEKAVGDPKKDLRSCTSSLINS
mmetsp:Transcript_7365/g.9590  ORF Transcript_7365/g.9590 Transcript_7365/m.9590 type:complete len:587 (+) Transcript_7365:74-1834(+)